MVHWDIRYFLTFMCLFFMIFSRLCGLIFQEIFAKIIYTMDMYVSTPKLGSTLRQADKERLTVQPTVGIASGDSIKQGDLDGRLDGWPNDVDLLRLRLGLGFFILVKSEVPIQRSEKLRFRDRHCALRMCCLSESSVKDILSGFSYRSMKSHVKLGLSKMWT